MLERIAIRFISWNLKRKRIDNLEVVIRSDGDTMYRRNKKREGTIQEVLFGIK